MVSRLLILLTITLLSFQDAFSQKNKPHLSIGIENQFLIGGELNASFDFLIGAKIHYFLKPKKKFHPFLSAGLATDIGNTNARIISSDIQLGTYWKFSQRFSLLMSLGGNYMPESHSLLLIDQQVNWNNTTLGITGNLGVNYRISESLFSTLFIKQTNFNFTSIGLGLNFSF